MNNIKKATVVFAFAIFIAAPGFTILAPQISSAVSNVKDCEKPFLGIPVWYRGLAVLDTDGNCSVAGPGQQLSGGSGNTLDLGGFIWHIALNIIEIGLFIVGYIAFFFIMFGGFQFLTGGGNPAQIEKARKTILNAVIGLAISIGAVAIVNLIFGILG